MKRSQIETKKGKRRLTVANSRFIGAGSTRQGKLAPVSERHDQALAEALNRENQQRFRRHSSIE